MPWLLEDKQVVQPELKTPPEEETKSGRLEDRRSGADLETIVLLELHAVDDPNRLQRVEDRIDQRGRNGDDETPPRREVLAAGVRERRLRVGRDMLEDGEHRDGVENAGGGRQIGGKNPGIKHGAVSFRTLREVVIDPDAAGGEPVPQLPEKRSVGTADIEQPRPLGNPLRRLCDAPPLQDAVGRFHQAFQPLRRRPRTLRKKLARMTWQPMTIDNIDGTMMRIVCRGSSVPRPWISHT